MNIVPGMHAANRHFILDVYDGAASVATVTVFAVKFGSVNVSLERRSVPS